MNIDADTLDDAIDAVDGRTHIRVWLTYGKLEARRYGDAFDVAIYGDGGGLVGRYEWDEWELRRAAGIALDAGGSAEVADGIFKR